MAKKKPLLYPILFMIGLTVIFTAILASINLGSQSIIAEQQALIVQKSVLYAFDIDYSTWDDDYIKSEFNSIIQTDTLNGINFYTYKETDVVGYALPIQGKGLWGNVYGHIAFSPDHKSIIGLHFTNHSETPGLGGRIDELWFKEQFRGIVIDTPIITLNKETGGNVDAIAGATLTSIAVKDIVNNALPELLELAVKEGFYED